jgi:hypothetical protein
MIMRSEKVPESPSSALHTIYFWEAAVARDHGLVRQAHRLPFDAGRKGRTAASAQPCVGDLLHDVCRLHGQRLTQSAITIVIDIVLQRHRVGDAHARKRQALLFFQKRNFFGQT